MLPSRLLQSLCCLTSLYQSQGITYPGMVLPSPAGFLSPLGRRGTTLTSRALLLPGIDTVPRESVAVVPRTAEEMVSRSGLLCQEAWWQPLHTQHSP